MNQENKEVTSNKEAKEIWAQCLCIIRDNLPEGVFSTWFSPIEPYKFEGKTLTIKVPSPFYYEYIEEHFFDLLKHTLVRVIGQEAKLVYSVLMVNKDNTVTNHIGGRIKTQSPTIGFNPFVKAHQKIASQLNSSYTMDSFVEGHCNILARAAGISIAQKPGGTYNPMFIYGGSGMGKTHLVHAIGLMAEELHPDKNILYVTASKFQSQYQEASLNNKVPDFLNFYQMIDILIVDDIQDLAGKTGTQNTFFHIFNHLHQNGKQLILTSDRPPKLLQGLDQRVLGRFKWGLFAELDMPDYETRRAIICSKIAQDGLVIPEDVIDYIAENVTESVRAIEGVIISLLAQSTLTNADININLVKRVVSSTVNIVEKAITISSIQKAVCTHYNLDPNDIQTKSRKREVVQARQIAMYLARKYTKNSLTTIGEQIGNRDHATVLHACKMVTDLIEIDKSLRQSLDAIEGSLK